MVTSPARRASPDHLPIRLISLIDAVGRGIPVQLGERRVLHPGRWQWLRAVALLVLAVLCDRNRVRPTSAGGRRPAATRQRVPAVRRACHRLRGRPRQLRPGRPVARGCRGAAELAVRPALPGLAVGAVLGLAMMAVLMGVLVATVPTTSPWSVPPRHGPGSAWPCRRRSPRSCGCAPCSPGCCGWRSDPSRPSSSRRWWS